MLTMTASPSRARLIDLMIQKLKNRVAKVPADAWTEDADRAALVLAYLYSRIYRN